MLSPGLLANRRNPPSAIWTAPAMVAPISPSNASAYSGTSAVTAWTVCSATAGSCARSPSSTLASSEKVVILFSVNNKRK